MVKESFEEKLERVLGEEIFLVQHQTSWTESFLKEKSNLISLFPKPLIKRVEHFGSTAIPNIMAKPIIDVLVEVNSLQEAKEHIIPILEDKGYDFFFRPSTGDTDSSYYAWFIKRNMTGKRSHHIHMVEKGAKMWECLRFRDYLLDNPLVAQEYSKLKIDLSKKFPNDRIKYTEGKGPFITKVTQLAMRKDIS